MAAIALRFHLLLLLIAAATANSNCPDYAAAPYCPSPIQRPDFSAFNTLRCHHFYTANLSSFTLVSASDLYSCADNMSPACTLAVSPQPRSDMPIMLNDAINRLHTMGYRVASVALSFKHAELSRMKAATVFALDDDSVFSGEGNAYLSNFWYHVVPGKRLTAADLARLPPRMPLPTMDLGQNLVVTAAGGGEPSDPTKINDVPLETVDLLNNSRIVVHGISFPFRRQRQYRDGYDSAKSRTGQIGRSKCDRFR